MVVWVCDKCPTAARKPRQLNHQEYHNCPALGNLSVPMIEQGQRVKVTVNEREDYTNGDAVQTDGAGRPVMSITVEREDGIDCSVYAPAATIDRR
jgi:hypothetical protein